MIDQTLFILPLEPLEERYTGQWYDWLPVTFARDWARVQVIDGQTQVTPIQVGAFLDLNQTAQYKASQLQQVAALFQAGAVHAGDAFWVSDLEFWGIEVIAYLARLQDIPIGLYAFLHAASYTRGDFMEPMSDIGQWVEVAWIAACTGVCVGSHYSRQSVIDRRLKPVGAEALADRLHVTGYPLRPAEVRALGRRGSYAPVNGERPLDLVYPHRPDKEKGLGLFLDWLEPLLRQRDLRVAFTTSRPTYRSTNDPETIARVHALAARHPSVRIYAGLSRADYFSLLLNAKVVPSASPEEMFGIAVIEGMMCGALPLLPNQCAYPETVQHDARFLYEPNRGDHFLDQLDRLLHAPEWAATTRAYAEYFADDEDRIRRVVRSQHASFSSRS